MKKISCVIMDWAGTAIDFGCFAPLNAFLKVFSEEKGIDIKRQHHIAIRPPGYPIIDFAVYPIHSHHTQRTRRIYPFDFSVWHIRKLHP